ncbi:B3 domain-containing protein REM20-like [Neltuma alba]|uniref:B3 domain-containing protein REM20-like n=1 Tax=Neltuma alba TaxID=207710 RepID=UPI0010A3B258|nr:B3 domain-containing protein REM20-like [Prosopis alba]
MDKQKNVSAHEYPEFFEVFLPKYNSERMRIPNAFVKCLREKVLKKAILKNRRGKMWHVNVSNINGGLYFDHGWQQFTKDNSLEVGYFMIFSFDGSNTFKFKIYKTNRCEMIETYEEKEEDKENDSVEEVEEEEEDDEDEDEDADVKEEKGEQVKNRRGSSSKAKPISLVDYGIDAEMYVEPDNPYFATKIGGNRTNELLLNYFWLIKRLPKHEVQEHHQEQGAFQTQDRSTCEGEVIKWKDGRLCIRKWASFCRRNGITNTDVCLCEFLLGDDGQPHTLEVHIVGIQA